MAERSALYWQVYERLTDDAELEEPTRALVEAAFDGPAAVRDALGASREATPRASVPPEVGKAPARAFLRGVEIEGFRGIGPKTTFDVPPGPGLSLVVGRNGSGKSSLAEGLEMLLTGESLRWATRRQKEWIGGFRNLHQPERTSVAAAFDLDGSGETLRLRGRPIDAGLRRRSLRSSSPHTSRARSTTSRRPTRSWPPRPPKSCVALRPSGSRRAGRSRGGSNRPRPPSLPRPTSRR